MTTLSDLSILLADLKDKADATVASLRTAKAVAAEAKAAVSEVKTAADDAKNTTAGIKNRSGGNELTIATQSLGAPGNAEDEMARLVLALRKAGVR